MKLTNTRKALRVFATSVVRDAKSNLSKQKMGRSNLAKSLGFTVKQKKMGKLIEMVEFTFGRSSNYWQYVDEGVRGKGGYKGKGGRGRARGKGSPFKFKKRNIKKGVIARWIKRKRIRLRDAKGKFKKKTKSAIKSAAFAIGEAIALRGLTRTQFFSSAYNKQLKLNTNKIVNAYAEDLAEDTRKKLNTD